MVRKKSAKNGIWGAAIILVLAIAACWVYQWAGSGTKTLAPAPDLKPQIKKTGAGVVLDYSEPSRRLIASMVQELSGANLLASQEDAVKKETQLTAPEAKVMWQVAAVEVNGQTQEIQERVRNFAARSGGRITKVEHESYHNHGAVRMDVSIADVIEGEPIGVVVCKVYLLPGQHAGVQQPPTITSNPGKAQLAIIIDDVGNNYDGWSTFMNINRPLTFAVLPYLSVSQESARQAVENGYQVMLHLPMEAVSVAGDEPYRIKTMMSNEEIRQITAKVLSVIPQAIGVNNHQGSKATADARVMKAVLGPVRERGLFFIDSRTSSQSVAYQTARNMGVRTEANDHFIDNDPHVEAVKAELRRAAQIALQHGSAVVIGHARANTARAVADMVAELEGQGIQLIFVSELVH